MPDLILAGGLVADGSGRPPRRADVVVRGGRIAEMVDGGLPAEPAGLLVVPVDGSLVCPGFVDIHTHSDLTLLSAPDAPSKVRQGVTTEIVGNCGLSVAPSPAADRKELRHAVSYLDVDPEVRWDWDALDGYLEALAAVRPVQHVRTLAGHLPLRAAVLGFGDRTVTAADLQALDRLLSEQFDAGVLGLSTGLAYPPLTFAGHDELLALGAVVARYDGIFAWHVRDYADELQESVAAAIDVARRTGCRTQLSHLVAVGRRNWGKVERALELVDQAIAAGLDVGVDVYPYLAGNAPLSQLLPAWTTPGESWDAATRERLRRWFDAHPLGWDDISISRGPAELQGRRLDETGDDPAGLVLDLLREHGHAVTMTAYGRSAEDLAAVLRHPASVIASDGQALDPAGPTGRGVPHPRSYGCFPRFLAEHTGSDGVPLGEAVRKVTAAPADRIGLRDRGRIRPGLVADLVVLDMENLADTATYSDPARFPRGIDLVMVGGHAVFGRTEQA
ncbi:N-acyl-D-amino-acid deacylase family protein [Flindersiella endophytica]